jgi:hypothetical protein
MRNLLAFLAMVVLAFFGAGWYLGWYKVQNTPTGTGHRSVNIDFNTEKIGEDLEKGTAKITKMLDKQGKAGRPQPAAVPGLPEVPDHGDR